MPDGTLMSDTEHARLRAFKVISNFNIDLNSISANGGLRRFSVVGTNGSIFSLVIKNAAGNYYDFSTKTFVTTQKRLKNQIIKSNIYNGSITFPSVGSDDQYDILLFAESAYNTFHADYKQVRFNNGSIDINSSTGSNSNLLQKVIYQYTDVTITLSATAPQTLRGITTGFSSMVVTTDTITSGRGGAVGKTAFSITVTAAAARAFQINKQPTINDLTAFTTAIFGDAVIIPGEDIWAGAVRNTDTTNGTVSSETAVTMDAVVANKMKVGDRVTGTGIASTSVVTVAALPSTYVFTASENVSIGDGVTLTFTPPYYYRYNVAASSSIHKLGEGMTYIDPDLPLIDRVTIGAYKATTTYTTDVHAEDGSIKEIENVITDVSIPPLDSIGLKPTIVKGLVTKQLGNITFSKQLINDVDDTNAKYFFGHGPSTIKKIHNAEIRLTDLKVELTAPTTTTTEATSAHATIAVADREGVINNISTVSGIGIDSSVADPTITSGGGADGAGDWIMGATQSLENGITLTVGRTSRVAVITGNIEFINVDDTNFTLYFDLERFLNAA